MKLYCVDAFTGEKFRGNPAGVVLADRELSEDWMQKVAAELRYSETVYVFPENGRYRLRYFTPATEVDLCGHATLATAYILYTEKKLNPNQPIKFISNVAPLQAGFDSGWISMRFPAYQMKDSADYQSVADILKIHPVRTTIETRLNYLHFELRSDEELKRLTPDFEALKKTKAPPIMVTALSSEDEIDFAVRFFAPLMGINEDPVTGSAQSALTPYWAEKTGKTELVCRQLSRRGGLLKLKSEGDQVRISGQARLIWKGEIEYGY